MSDERDSKAQSSNGQFAPGTETRSEGIADSEEPSTDRQLLNALVRRNEELLQARSLLTDKVNVLQAALAKAHRYAHYDELTGLPNRRLLLDRFLQASSLAMRHRQLLAMLFFDLDDFKGVNDTLGHKAGDKLLRQVAQRLSSVIRQSDTACRYGGDEFVVLMTEVDSRDRAAKKMNEIRTRLEPGYVVDGYEIQQTTSIGLAIYPNDSEDFSELLRLSDESMFDEKVGNRVQSGDKHDPNIRIREHTLSRDATLKQA